MLGPPLTLKNPLGVGNIVIVAATAVKGVGVRVIDDVGVMSVGI